MVFDFPYHRVRTKYVDSSVRTQFGKGYTHTAPPSSPTQRSYVLNFPAMKYFVNSSGLVDETINPKINMYRLILFYEAHELHGSFTYPHPYRGNLTVRFARPLEEPSGIPGADGLVEPFEIEFIEVR